MKNKKATLLVLTTLVLISILSMASPVELRDGVTLSESVELGRFYDASGLSFPIPIRNNSARELKLMKIASDCSCVTFNFNPVTIPPHGSFNLNVNVRPELIDNPDDFKRRIVIETSDGALIYLLNGKRDPAVHVTKDTLTFHDVKSNTASGLSETIEFRAVNNDFAKRIFYSGGDDRFIVKLVEVNDKTVKANVRFSDKVSIEPFALESFVSDILFGVNGVPLFKIGIKVLVDVKVNATISKANVNLGLVSQGDDFQDEVCISNKIVGSAYLLDILDSDGLTVEIQPVVSSVGQWIVKINGKIVGKEGAGFKRKITLKTNDPNESLIYVNIYGAIPKTQCCN